MATDDGKNQSTTDIQKHLNQLIDEETATTDRVPVSKKKEQPEKVTKPLGMRLRNSLQQVTARFKSEFDEESSQVVDDVLEEELPEINDDEVLDEENWIEAKSTLTDQQKRGVLVIVGLTIGAVFVGWLCSPWAQVQNYEIKGNDDLTKAQVLSAAGLNKYQSTFLTVEEGNHFDKTAQKNNAQISGLSLKIKNPMTVIVTVKENHKVGYIKTKEGYQALLQDGQVVKESFDQRPSDSYAVYDNFPKDRKTLNATAKRIGKLNGPIRRSISDVVWSPTDTSEDRLLLSMNDGNQVVISASDIDNKMQYYPSIATQFKNSQDSKDDKKTIIDLQVGAYGYQQAF